MKKYAKTLGVAICIWMGLTTAKADITFYVHTTEDWSEVKMHTWSGYNSWNDDSNLFTAVSGTTNTWVYTVSTNSDISFDGYAYTGALDGSTADHSARGVDVNIGQKNYTNGGTYVIHHFNKGSSWVEKVSDISGLTKAGATSFFISGGQTDSAPTSTNGGSNYAYAKNDGTVSVTQNVSDPYSLGDFYKWNIYTDNSGTGGANHFTIVNVATGQFINIPTAMGQDFTLADSKSATTLISLYNYDKSGTAGHASGAEAAAGLGNVNIQNGDNGKGVSNGTKCTTKNNESYTGHFMFTPTELTGLTFHSGPYLIRGLCTINSTVNNTYIYADGTTVKYTETEPSASNTVYMWEIYTVNTPYDGNGGDFAIRNVSTGCCIYVNGTTLGLLPFNSGSNYGKLTIWGYGGDHTPNNGIANSTKVGTSNITNDLHFAIQDYQWTNKAQYSNGNITAADASGAHFVLKETSYPSDGPAAPTNVAAARASATSVTITWDAVDGASGYTLYKSTNGSSWDGGTAAATNSATDSGLTSDIRYYYKVTATVGGDESSASSVVSAVPGTLPSNLAFVAGPFMIRNNYTGFGYQYLYDNTTDNDYTGTEETKNGSDSDGTSYANYGRVLRNVQGADSDATYLTNANYMWDIYSYTIGGNTYYALRNVVTGRFMHTGAYTDYISQWGDNNSINAFAWNTTNVSGATGIDNSNNANKELSYYLYNFKVAAVKGTTPASQADATVNASGFTAQIMTQRWTWGQRSLHGQIGESLVSNNQVYATNNTYEWGTKSWLFTTATRPAPTGLTATPGATTADLAWNATEGTLIYTVYRSTTEGSGYAEIGTTTTNSYADSGLTKGTTYYYKVTATAGTSTSAQSAAVSVTTLIEPAAPTNVAAAPDCSATDKIIVTWDAAAGATNYDVEAYDSSTARWYEKAKNVTATTATITVAGGYKAYPIHVKAKNAAGSSAWANAAADGWPASPSPTLTVSGTTAASVTLAWTDIAGQTYDVYRSAYVDGNYKLLASGQSNGYTDNAVFSGSKYYYKLKVTDATCGTRWSNSVNTTTTHTLGVPVPRIKSKDVAKVTIEWNAVAGAGGYRIYRSTNGTNYDFIGLTNETTYTDDVNNGCNGYMSKHKTYFYKITAVEEGLEQWFYTDGVSYPNPCSDTEDLRTRVMEKALYAGRSEGYCSWRSDGGGYKFINGEVYKTKNDGKYQSCGTMSDGYAWFSNAVSTAGEYRLEAFVALNTGTTDVWMSANLANAANAADSTKAYVFFDNIVPLPSVEANCDNGSWQNYYPYEGALALNAGDNTVYYSIKGGQNVLKYTLSRGESDLSLAVAVEFIPAPSISAEATSITNARITWAKIEGADYYKIRYKDFTENKTTTEGIGWTEWELMPTANDTVYNFTINPTHQYRYQVKSFVGTIGNTPIAESAVANNYVSTKDYAPQLKASATGATSVRLKIMTTAKSRVSEVDSYTIYYSDDKENWTSATVSRVGTDTLVHNVTGLKPSTVYFFKATAKVTIDETAYTSMESTPVAATTEEIVPELSFENGVLTWTSVSDATEYRIYRRVTAGSGAFANIATVSGDTAYIDRSATGGYGYTYKVAAVSPHGEIFEQWAYDKSGNGQYVARERTDQWGTDGNNNKYYEGVPFDTEGRYTAGNTGTYLKFSVQSHYNATYKVETYLARNDVNIGGTNYLHSEYTGVKPANPYADFSNQPCAGPCFGMDNGWQNYRSFDGNIPMTAAAQNVYLVGGGINFMKMVFWVNDVMAEGKASDTVAVTTPPVITDIECYGGNSVTINWTYNETADKYYIYRCATENGEYEKIGESTAKSYTDNIALGNTYYYKVSAVTGGGVPTYAEIIAQYANEKEYAPAIVEGASSSLIGNDTKNISYNNNIDGTNYAKATTATIGDWAVSPTLHIAPADKDGSTYNEGTEFHHMVICARLITEGVLSNNAGINPRDDGYPSNPGTSDASFVNYNSITTLTTSDKWFIVPMNYPGANKYRYRVRVGMYDPDLNIAIRYMFMAKTAPSLSTAEESDKSAAMAGGCTTMADTIIWTGSAATDAWNDIDNWDIIENGETRAIEASDAFGTPLTVIMPAELGTPTFDGGLGRINAASDIVLAYGALFDMSGFNAASGVCHSLTTSLVVRGEDRGEWILAGPNLKMKEGDGTREQLSGDYYLDKLPWVYMHEISIVQGDNPTISWQNAFPQLTEVLTPESAFAIRVDNKYGKYGINSERYYSKDSVKKHLGEQDVVFTFEGVPYPTPTFDVPAGNWTVITNTTTGNISIADLLNNEGGQAAVWNFNTGSKGNKGSWNTYANAAAAEGVYVIPATAFLYKPTADNMTADQVLAYTDYTLSGKYHVTAALDGVPDPTLTLTAANGKYAAQTSVTYNAFISDEETEEPTNNALKVFSSYDGVPDICSYNGGTAYFSRTVNGSTTTVPLGVSATSDMTFTLTAQGAENFKAAVLDDRLTGISYNLKTQAALEFDIEAGENKDRFFLNLEYDDTLQPTTDIDENAADDITVTCNDKRIIIKSAGADLRKVRIADAAGRSTKTDASGRMEIIDMNGYANGVYMVTVWTKNGNKTERIIVK